MSTKIPMFIGYDPENDKLFNTDGNIVSKSTLYPDSVIGEKKLVNFKLSIRQDDDSLVDYKEIPTGTTFEALVDNDYSNPTFTSFENDVSDWTNTIGSEYAYQIAIATEPEAIYENNIIMTRGTAGSLASGEWDYIGTTITVRLSDDTAPSSKTEDYLQYISGTYTPLFLFTANTGFNLTNTWYDQSTESYRDPVPENGELTFEINANTEDFSTRLANESEVLTTKLQIQLFESGTGEFSKMFEVNFVCRNRFLQNPLSLEVTGVNVYSKAEIDALLNAKVDKDLSGYTSKGSLDGTETIYIDDNGTPKATSSSSLLNVPSNQITGVGTVNMRTDVQFPTNYTDGLIYTIGNGVTAITDGTTTINVNAQDTAIVINKDVSKASIDLTTDINQIAKQNLNPNIDTVQFNTSLSAPSYNEGLLFYDQTNKCVAFFNDESDVIQQIGQEIWIRVYNDTGGLIENGKACYLSGVFSGFPTVAKAQSNDASTCLATIGIATHSIEDGTYGYITRIGTVRGVDTSLCTAGDVIYLSDTSAGDWTKTAPNTPSYVIELGNCSAVDAISGTIEVNISIGNNYNDIVKFYNGSTLESSDIEITSDGANVTLSVQGSGGSDLVIFFDGNPEIFDTTPAQTITLTAGTDTLPTRNYVYIPKSTKLLTKSTSGFPTTEQYIPLTDCLIPSASRVQLYGVYKDHNWTDHLINGNETGHLGHLNEWIRKQPATYDSGILPSFTGSGTATIEMSSTSGVVLQLHRHDFPAFTSPTPLYVYNDSVTPYNRVTNIASIISDSTGASLLGGTYALVIWGVISENASDCKFFVNLPTGKYGTSKPDETRIDANGYTNFSIPLEYRGAGFLVHRLIISANIGGTAFTIYTDSSDDLRGLLPNTSAGSTTGGGAGTGDMQTSIYDPAGIGEQLVGLTASQTLTNKTLTSPIINTQITGTAVLDDDTFATANDITVATSESIKAYADTKATGAASSTDNAIVRFDSTTGKLIQNSLVTITDAGKQTFPNISTTGIINATERSVEPSAPASGDIYLDDGTNSASGNPQWRRYTGSVWEDIGGGVGGLNWGSSVVTSTISAVSGSGYVMDMASSAFSLTLDGTYAFGDTVGVKVINSTIYSATLDLNGGTLDGTAGNITLDNLDGFELLYLGSNNWTIVELAGSPAGSGTSSPLTTKGDLYTYSTINARLPVGTNGQILSADSAEATGLKWTDLSGGGLINKLTGMTAETFSYPKTSITNPFTNAANSPNIFFDIDNYAVETALVSTTSNEPMQIPEIFEIPAGITNLIFRIIYVPENGQTWNSESIVWKGEAKNTTDNTSWSTITSFTIGTDTAPSSGSNPLVFESTVSLATMGLSAGDSVLMDIFLDSTTTFTSDIGFQSLEIEVS